MAGEFIKTVKLFQNLRERVFFVDEAERFTITHRFIVMTGLCSLAVACNLVGPSIFWGAGYMDWLQYCAFVTTGALVAEVCLLAIWCGLSQQAIKFRLPVTVALLLVVACSFCIGLQLPDLGRANQGMPLEAALMISGAGFGLFVVMQVPLWIIRRTTGCRIATPETATLGGSLQGRQFSVGYLMLWTAMIGVLLVLVRNSLPEAREGIPPRDLVSIVMFLLIYVGLSSLLCMPCIWITLAERPQIRSALTLAGAIVAGPFVILVCTNMIFPGQQIAEVVPSVLCYELGLAGTTLAMLFVLRLLGYRMLVTK